jgi:cobaltochelatase CobN
LQDAGFVLDAADCPVIQAYTIGAPRDAWAASGRGMNASDLAMQVLLLERDREAREPPVEFRQSHLHGEVGRVHAAARGRAAAWVRLRRTPREQRRLAMVLSDYPARGGRAGYAVGLDTPE